MRHWWATLALIALLACMVPATAAAATGNPFGATRTLWAQLSGAAEGGDFDADAFGFAKITINPDTGALCYRLSVANIDPAIAAHIHVGAAGVSGPVVVPFDAPNADGLVNGCTTIDPALAAAILANPSGYYVNVHTAAYPGGVVRGQLLPLGAGGAVQQPSLPIVETVADGLNSPRGIAIGADGALYLTDAGAVDAPDPASCVSVGEGEENQYCFVNSGSVIKVMDGQQTTVATGLPGSIDDIVVTGTGELYVLTGLGGDPAQLRPLVGDLATGYGAILNVDTETNAWTVLADVSGYEVNANPDGGAIDTNPFGLTVTDDGFLVADAGGNDLLHVSMAGDISTVAVFPSQMVDAPPFLELPAGTQIPMEAVPTSVVVGPDGADYVSELTGFPFQVGAARVWRVQDLNADGDALDDGELSVAYAGFTNILDIGFDAAGRLYVLEIAQAGLLQAESDDPEQPGDFTGALIRVGADGTQTTIMSDGLVAPTGMTMGPLGALYVANFGVMPGMGQVLKLTVTD
jgi:hypothetical protein